ncbi:MAG TPA: hypothetical protein VH594_22760 [Trebonia sp.]
MFPALDERGAVRLAAVEVRYIPAIGDFIVTGARGRGAASCVTRDG